MSKRLIDTLPDNGRFFDPGAREDEAELVEDLRRGSITVLAYVPMKLFEPVLRGRMAALSGLSADKVPLTWADWARLRFHLQDLVQDYLESFTLDLVPVDGQYLVSLEPEALEVPDVWSLGPKDTENGDD